MGGRTAVRWVGADDAWTMTETLYELWVVRGRVACGRLWRLEDGPSGPLPRVGVMGSCGNARRR